MLYLNSNKFKESKFGINTIILFLFFCFSVKTFTQNINNLEHKKISFSLMYGNNNSTLKGSKSLSIVAFPSYFQKEKLVKEQYNFSDVISNSYYLELGIKYNLKPNLFMGLSINYKSPINYNSQLFFFQEKVVLSNNSLLFSTGFYTQNTSIKTMLITAVSGVNWFTLKTENLTIGLETEIGIGAAFLSLNTSLYNVNLQLNEYNNYTTINSKLGPGYLNLDTNRFTNLSWQISTALSIKSKTKPEIKIGVRYTNLGSVIIAKQPINKQQLFMLSTTTTGAEDQNLVLKTNTTKRQLFSKAVYIQFVF